MANTFQERMEQRQREEAEAMEKLNSMMPSAESFLRKGDLSGAAKLFEDLWRAVQTPFNGEECFKALVKKYPPLPEACESCGAEVEWTLEVKNGGICACAWWKCEWQKQPCRRCAEIKIRAELKERCPAIMLNRGFQPRFFDSNIKKLPKPFLDALGSDRGVFICGSCGSGKTYGLSAYGRNKILTAPIVEGNRCDPQYDPPLKAYFTPDTDEFPLFVSVPKLLARIRASFKSNDESENEIIKELSEAKILMLDDLGAEKVTEWARSVLYLIIDGRYSLMRRTIITSNLTLSEISELIDDRIASRIAEMCQVVHLKGQDRRLSAAA